MLSKLTLAVIAAFLVGGALSIAAPPMPEREPYVAPKVIEAETRSASTFVGNAVYTAISTSTSGGGGNITCTATPAASTIYYTQQ